MNNVLHILVVTIFPLVLGAQPSQTNFEHTLGAITRGNIENSDIALVFTGDEFADGMDKITRILDERDTKCSFFFTGRFYRNAQFRSSIQRLISDGHYLGAHSDDHLLYCDWQARDSLLVTRSTFTADLEKNYREMARFGIEKREALYFLPPYEWYNETISTWTAEEGLQLINLTRGTLSHADYTTPDMPQYRSSKVILKSILDYEASNAHGLNGFILLLHVGASPARTDKLYGHLDGLMQELTNRGYSFVRIDELLN